MRLEAQRRSAVERGDVLPRKQGGLPLVPGEDRIALDRAGDDEDRGAKAVAGEDRKRVLRDVEIAVVEAEPDDVARHRSAGQEPSYLYNVDDAVSIVSEEVHLAPEAARRNCELVVVIRDPVVEENPDALASRAPSGSRQPGEGPRPCERRLPGIEARRLKFKIITSRVCNLPASNRRTPVPRTHNGICRLKCNS
jgi:hypothetical protein